MSVVGKIFGTDEAISKTIDTVANGLDKLIYTDQERAADQNASISEARSMVVKWMEATQGQNLARRLIALSIAGTWLADIILSQLVGAVGIFFTDPKVDELSKFMSTSASSMQDAVMLILAFYFAAPHMGQIASAVIGRSTGVLAETPTKVLSAPTKSPENHSEPPKGPFGY